ncbi:MAG: hypothetical protein JSU01_01300, partial [Bacteroidetes bacterium]|nr:hypothetical protein [Bacteroidota bacterium]
SPHFRSAGMGLRRFTANHPKLLFGTMIAAITISAALSFTVFRQKGYPPERKPVKMLAPVTGGIDKIMQTGDAIRQMLALKKQIDSLSSKKQLNASDSIALENALDRFRQLSWKFDSKPARR